VIDDAFSTTERAEIAAGITHIHDNSCVRFVARDGDADYLEIIPGDGGCYAIIPYRPGGGKHTVGLQQSGCVTLKIVVHELLHALGIKHEQCRFVVGEHIAIMDPLNMCVQARQRRLHHDGVAEHPVWRARTVHPGCLGH
jgi:choriolysin H